MTNQKLIKERWQFTDHYLRVYYKKFKTIFNDLQDDLIDLFNELDISREDLNKTISSSWKRKLKKKERDWKNQGIVIPYFQFLLDTFKPTYSNLIKLLVYAEYLKYKNKEFDECKALFERVANDVYYQAQQQSKVKSFLPAVLLWTHIKDWAIVQTVDVSFEDYLEILNQTASEEMSKLFIASIKQEIKLDATRSSLLIEKQLHRLISINKNKYSGVIETTARQIGNMAYTEPFSNQKVMFVAEMDERTTKMCMSMNGFIFNTKDENVFYRYSDEIKSKKLYKIQGLVLGINQPPILDHFHYCRSILTYQIDLNDKEIRQQMKNQGTA